MSRQVSGLAYGYSLADRFGWPVLTQRRSDRKQWLVEQALQAGFTWDEAQEWAKINERR